MKSLFFKLIILLIIISSSNLIFSQNASVSFTDIHQSKSDTYIKSLTGKCIAEKVYLNIIANGIKESTYYSVERSIDGANYEAIGLINFIGSPAPIDLLYSYVDENPLKVNTYYRLVTYNDLNESVATDNILVGAVNTASAFDNFNNLQAKNN